MSAFADNFKVEKNWYAAIVRPRSEKLVIKLL